MEEWFRMSEAEVLRRLKTEERQGLTSIEAEERRKRYGPNCLAERKKQGVLRVFLDQFKDLLVIILMIAAVISTLSGDVESTAVIFAVLLLNAVLGTVEHEKARKSLDSLKSLSAPVAKVIREGSGQEIF